VVKDGSGTWTYGSTIGTIAAGIGTTVAGGTLLVDTTSNGTTTGILGPVTVNNTGTGSAVLGGSGSIVGAVGVTGGGKINPGDVGVGAANVGTLTLLGGVTASGASVSSGAFFQFDLDSDADSADKISTTNLTLGSGISTLSLDDLGSTPLTTGTTFNLVAYTGTLSGTFQNYANNSDITVGNNTYVLNYGTGTNSDISLTSVPEPTTWLYSVVGLAALLGVQRRRGPVRA
jgi:hypothetical protein